MSKVFTPNFNDYFKSGNFGDIYKTIENDNILVKFTHNKFSKELFQIIKKLNHENIIKIIDINPNIYNKLSFIFMENFHGDNLSIFFSNNTTCNLPPNINLKIIKQIIDPIFLLHENNIIHRDLKLDNILINKNYQIKIIDFENSFYGRECSGLVGSPGYFAPEMLFCEKYNNKCDIWSLGVIFYFIICKYFPFHNSNNLEIYKNQILKNYYIIYDKNKWYNYNKLLKIIKKMLLYNKDKRIDSNYLINNI